MKNKKTIIIVLVILEIVSVSLMWKSLANKETILDNVKLKEKLANNESFAIMLEQEDGTYIQSSESSFPTNMAFNSELSGCIDNNGNKLNDVLSYDETQKLVNVTTSSTTYCYLYFDTIKSKALSDYLINNVSEDELWNSTLEDDGYRYVGTNPSNYICFGTSDKSTCTGDTDKYMYRIIGIFEDSSGNNHLKLIKKEALNTAYAWNSSSSNVDWNSSTLYTNLNGSYFLTNTSYPYMQNTTWTNKISTWNYTMTNTLTYSNGGLYYHYNTGQTMYLHELNRSSKTSQTCYNQNNSGSTSYCSVGTWTSLSTKISLMYASDYQLSLGSVALSYTGSSNYSTLKTGWLHLSNNDSSAPNSHEWTMSRYGANSYGNYGAWYVTSSGNVNYDYVTSTYAVRPVFYLESEVEYGSGSGTIEDPIILKDDVAPVVNTTINDNNTAPPTLTITSDESGTYCINTSSTAGNMNNCVFEGSITANTSITTSSFTNDGIYYVHVKDSSGNIGISSAVNITLNPTPLYEQLINTVSSSVLWNSTLEDDGYRYVGTDPANYICFGTSDKSACTGDTDKYMYRIIGIFEDSSGNNHVKLIKKEALNTEYAWNSYRTTDTAWDKSALYSGLNGSYFLTNTSYPYMQNTTWTNKISIWNYTMTNTLSYSNYKSNGTYGLDYYHNTGQTIYLHELNRSSKTSQTCYYDTSTTTGCSVGTWTNLSTKISLMYASDYQLSLGSSALTYTGSSNYSTLKTGWMHITNNDTGNPGSNYEWTMSRYGALYYGGYSAWAVLPDGDVHAHVVDNTLAVRPVFYLESETEYSSGSGTLSDPYIIAE